MDNSTIKKNIRDARKRCGLTQEFMALNLGISLTAYRDLETGSTAMINSNISKIAELVDMSTEELILGYRPEPSDGILEDAQAEYGSKVSNLQTRIADLENLIYSKEEIIRSKDEIISMLKKIIDGKE